MKSSRVERVRIRKRETQTRGALFTGERRPILEDTTGTARASASIPERGEVDKEWLTNLLSNNFAGVNLTDEQIQELANYYTGQSRSENPVNRVQPIDGEVIRPQEIYNTAQSEEVQQAQVDFGLVPVSPGRRRKWRIRSRTADYVGQTVKRAYANTVGRAYHSYGVPDLKKGPLLQRNKTFFRNQQIEFEKKAEGTTPEDHIIEGKKLRRRGYKQVVGGVGVPVLVDGVVIEPIIRLITQNPIPLDVERIVVFSTVVGFGIAAGRNIVHGFERWRHGHDWSTVNRLNKSIDNKIADHNRRKQIHQKYPNRPAARFMNYHFPHTRITRWFFQ